MALDASEKQSPIWFPSESYIRGSHLERLIDALGIALDPADPDRAYQELYRQSLADPDRFWRTTFDLIGIEWQTPYRSVVDLSQGPQWPRWFPGGRLNLTHNALYRHARGPRAAQDAIIWEGEDGLSVSLSYAELADLVARAANALRALGVRKGDRVGIYLPMIPETAISALAISQIGAIFIPIFSGYAAEAAAVRLRDAGAKVLITADGFYRRGQTVPLEKFAREAARLAGCVEQIVVVRRLGVHDDAAGLFWDRLIAEQSADAEVEPMEAMDPCMLIYTSGTTGRPKGTVHYHAGFPLKAAQDLAHLFDLRAGEVLFWFTDMGWMMGPWLIVGALTLGATAVLYEGAPDYPAPDRVWSIVERHRVTHAGISPTLVRGLMPHGVEHVARHDLSALRILGATGELWNPEAYMWLFENVGQRRRPIINYTGGTEIAGGILGCVVFRPILPCAFNSAIPGMRAAVLDERGRPVIDEVGELAVMNPWPGMTNGFWNDPERYLETYWSRFDGVWVHGDFASVDSDAQWMLYGRSDDTLKIAGKRVGPAEIEAAASEIKSIREVAAVGVPHPTKGEVPVVFAVLTAGEQGSDALAAQVAERIVAALGKPLRPERVYFVTDLPKTRNAKIMRRVVRAVHLGRDPGDLSALENPGAIDSIPRAAG
jgi:acetyl-CoA synthetase